MFLAESLASFIVATRARTPPPEAIAAAQMRLLDGLGVALAALDAASVMRPRVAMALFGRDGPASAIGYRTPCPAMAAALHNGLLMHALEFDDTHIGGVVHGAPVVLPAVLAYAEQAGCTGDAMLRAICVGWEVLARIGAAFRGELHRHGFQATSVAGPLAAAAAVAYMCGLNARRTVHALGIAGSQSSGVFEFLADGATSKRLHGGWAALGGLIAASLAADGMTGPASILEGRHGLFAAFAREPALASRMEARLGDLGERWAVCETRPKIAPCCHYIQAFLEALDALLQDGVAASQIRGIHCIVDPRQAQLICEPWPQKLSPSSGYTAKWSLPFCLAALALRGSVDVSLFERPFEADLLAFARRISWSPHEDGFPDRYPGRMTVTLEDGATRESFVPDVLGAPTRPFTHERLIAKFRKAAARVMPLRAIDGLVDELLVADRSPSPTAIGGYLRAAGRNLPSAEGRPVSVPSHTKREPAPQRVARRVVQ
jgi:2-methylcitrate dehydratase PrpD